MPVHVLSKGEEVFVDFRKVAEIVGLSGHIKKNGWKFIDAVLRSKYDQNISCFLASTSNKRSKRWFISYGALHVLLTHFKSGDHGQKTRVCEEISKHIESLAAKTLRIIKNDDAASSTPPSFSSDSHSSPSCQSNSHSASSFSAEKKSK